MNLKKIPYTGLLDSAYTIWDLIYFSALESSQAMLYQSVNVD